MRRRLIYMFAFLCTVFGFYGCQAEDGGSNMPQGEDGEVFFSLNIPQVSADITRAISISDEQTIETIDILAFDANDKYAYHTLGTVTSGAGTATQGIKAKVQRGDNQRFVFIINARSALNTAIANATAGTDTRETLLAGITLSLSAGTGWNATSSSSYTALPMWGDTGTSLINIPAGGYTHATPVALYRSVARIQVVVASGVTNFDLDKVHLYRSNLSGRVAPAGGVTNAVSLPSGVAAAGDTNPITYNNITGNALERAIYTFERANTGTGTNKDNRACLVLEGSYTDSPNTTDFYRIDFIKNAANLDLIRNHSYTVTITAVHGPGYDTAPKALNGEAMNIVGEIQPWNPDDLTNVIVNGQYALGINKNYWEFEYPAVTTGNDLLIKTNYPGGWTIDNTNFPAWFSVSATSGAGNATAGETVKLQLANNTGAERTTSFNVTAGMISLPVTVKQKVGVAIEPTGVTINSSDSKYTSGSRTLTLTSTGTAGRGTLYGTIAPTTSDVKDIVWSIPNATYTKIVGGTDDLTATTTSGSNVTFEAVKNGTVTVTATVTKTNGAKLTATATVKVSIPVEPTGLTISSTDSKYNSSTKTLTLMNTGSSGRGILYATISPITSDVKTITWSIPNTSYAKIVAVGSGGTYNSTSATTGSGTNLCFEAIAGGTVPVTATVTKTDGTKITATANIYMPVVMNLWGGLGHATTNGQLFTETTKAGYSVGFHVIASLTPNISNRLKVKSYTLGGSIYSNGYVEYVNLTKEGDGYAFSIRFPTSLSLGSTHDLSISITTVEGYTRNFTVRYTIVNY